MSDIPDADMMKGFNAGIVDEFRANGGKVGGNFEGATMVLLTTTGAKSGIQRLTPPDRGCEQACSRRARRTNSVRRAAFAGHRPG